MTVDNSTGKFASGMDKFGSVFDGIMVGCRDRLYMTF